MSPANTVKLDIPKSARFVTVVRDAVESIATRAAFPDETVADIKLAVGEACTNAVKFGDPASTRVRVLCKVEHDRLEIEVQNNGEGFEVITEQVDRSDLSNLPEGGMGIQLIRQVMDELMVTSDDGVTSVRMVKILRAN